MAPILLACVGGGVVLGSRQAVVVRLRQLTKELHEQREATARVAVAADRAQIATGLDGFLQDQISRIGRAAAAGHTALLDRPDDAERAFVTIQAAGRLTLGRMRDIVADLSDDGVPDRSRLLAGLDRMLADATEGQASLRIVGDPWLLPPGVELSSFRIVEQLLPCLQPTRPGLLEVTVTFGRSDLGLTGSADREPSYHRPTGAGGGPPSDARARAAHCAAGSAADAGRCLSPCRSWRRMSDTAESDTLWQRPAWPAPETLRGHEIHVVAGVLAVSALALGVAQGPHSPAGVCSHSGA